jgi:hypothetical protein
VNRAACVEAAGCQREGAASGGYVPGSWQAALPLLALPAMALLLAPVVCGVAAAAAAERRDASRPPARRSAGAAEPRERIIAVCAAMKAAAEQSGWPRCLEMPIPREAFPVRGLCVCVMDAVPLNTTRPLSPDSPAAALPASSAAERGLGGRYYFPRREPAASLVD